MKPVDFPQANTVFAKDQPEYLPLPARLEPHAEGAPVTSCWQFTPEELAQIQATGCVYVTQLTFGQALQPQVVSLDPPGYTDAQLLEVAEPIFEALGFSHVRVRVPPVDASRGDRRCLTALFGPERLHLPIGTVEPFTLEALAAYLRDQLPAAIASMPTGGEA